MMLTTSTGTDAEFKTSLPTPKTLVSSHLKKAAQRPFLRFGLGQFMLTTAEPASIFRRFEQF
jgi:hypothetical protein